MRGTDRFKKHRGNFKPFKSARSPPLSLSWRAVPGAHGPPYSSFRGPSSRAGLSILACPRHSARLNSESPARDVERSWGAAVIARTEAHWGHFLPEPRGSTGS